MVARNVAPVEKQGRMWGIDIIIETENGTVMAVHAAAPAHPYHDAVYHFDCDHPGFLGFNHHFTVKLSDECRLEVGVDVGNVRAGECSWVVRDAEEETAAFPVGPAGPARPPVRVPPNECQLTPELAKFFHVDAARATVQNTVPEAAV